LRRRSPRHSLPGFRLPFPGLPNGFAAFYQTGGPLSMLAFRMMEKASPQGLAIS
jgi:hypothetical protein